ncbi:MAG: hypothetical protein JOZ39_11385 [Chloroflexi bacterium]|nr:hypothetical protein [Chloroflexota bacterium]
MTVAILLALAGLVLVGLGMSRGNPVALVVGALLVADSMLFYIVFGPAATFSRDVIQGLRGS